MKNLVKFVKKIVNAVMPSKYASRFDRLSEENQRTFGSNYPRSGW